MDGTIEREALRRILVALASMAGLLDAACLPRDIFRAVARPLRAAEAAARNLPADHTEGSPAAAHLRRCFAALCRALDALVRGLRQPAAGRLRRAMREAYAEFPDLHGLALRAMERCDTS